MTLSIYSDENFMQQALKEAQKAYEVGEVPVGAIVVCQNQIIARGYNQTEQLTDVTAHAEIIALTAAANYFGSKYLAWAQLGRLVYGAEDEKRGFMRFGKGLLHPKTIIEYGILSEECGTIVKTFFKNKR